MKTNRIKVSLLVAAWFSFIVFAMLPGVSALADGTETLGPFCQVEDGSNSYRCVGDGIVAAGVGMIENNMGTISFTIPAAATVDTALLYWARFNTSVTTDGDTITLNGLPIKGTLIGGPTELKVRERWEQTYRADITGEVAAGFNSFEVSDMGFDSPSVETEGALGNNGTGILVIYTDGSGSWVDLRDGDIVKKSKKAKKKKSKKAKKGKKKDKKGKKNKKK